MLDSETHIYGPRAWSKDEKRVVASLKDEGCEVLLIFDDFAADGPVREVRLLPIAKTPFEPWRIIRKMPHYLLYARAAVTHRHEDAAAALRTIRKANAPGRGVDEEFLRYFAAAYNSLVAEGERYPSKIFALNHGVDKSQVSRWRKAATDRGLVKEADHAR